MRRFEKSLTLLCVLWIVSPSLAQQRGAKPQPNLADVNYGPHERNVLDLWLVKANEPTPLVLFIHGGGFRAGDKGRCSRIA